MLPLSEQLLYQQFGENVPPANSGYGEDRRRRRRMKELTEENTLPIRIKVDYQSLYKETAPMYSACFEEGEWYARGLAGPTPPTDGVATCAGLATDQDCWGKCTADDLIDEASRNKVKTVVNAVVKEVEGFFSLIRSDEDLTFDKSLGRYAGVYNRNGYLSEEACARDCVLLSGAAVAPSYCETGVPFDVVLSITKPALLPGVAGTGGACASDATGRPTWIVFAWIQKIVGMEGTLEELLEKHRPLIMHEIFHGLGFSNTNFRSATDSGGKNKGLLSLLPVVDLDGATDEVWYFTKGRAYELAQLYFDCTSNGSWTGLPLMGLPELGRASHWETRIMRDDFMSYGRTVHAVSSITLAAMEDLGFYRANYSAAHCMSWGYKQGCDFVKNRCGSMIKDYSQVVKDRSECKGSNSWATPNEYLAEKCQLGIDPCEDAFWPGNFSCNAQCYTGPERDGCQASPSSKLETAGEGGLSKYLPHVSWEQFLFFGLWLFAVCALGGIVRKAICPKAGSRLVIGVTSGILTIAGLLTLVFNALTLAKTSTIPQLELLGEQVTAFIGEYIMACFLVVGLVLFLVGIASLVGIWKQSPKIMTAVWGVWFVMLLCQFIFAFLLCWWVYVIEDVPNETLATLQGKDDGRYAGMLGANTLTNVEGFMCHLYQKCCRDALLDEFAEVGSGDSMSTINRTCLYSHEGVGSAVQLALQDPSSPKFCPYVTGSERRIAPPSGICNPLDVVFPLDACRENFCLSGAEGYYNFLNQLVAFIKEYATGFGGLFACLVLVQLVLLINLWNLRGTFQTNVEISQKSGVNSGGSDGQPARRSRAQSVAARAKPRTGSVAAPQDDLRRNISL